MSGYVTLEARKRKKRQSQLRAFDCIRKELKTFPRNSSGLFFVFGSFVDNSFTLSSDLDVLVDFPESERAEAMQFVENICFRYGIKPDVRPSQWCSELFVLQVKRNGVQL